MAIKQTVNCDFCGVECKRWYELDAFPTTSDPQLNIGDMIPPFAGGLGYRLQCCKPCFDKLFLQKLTEAGER